MDARLTSLEDARDDLARRWLVRVIEEAPIEEVGRLPVDRIVSELPDLISDVLRGTAPGERPDHAAQDDALSEGGPAQSRPTIDAGRAAARLAALSGRRSDDPAGLARDVARLQSVITERLAREAAHPEARAALAAADRVGQSLATVLGAAVSDLAEARSRELESLANTDALTGLFNVRYMNRHLAHLVGIQQRYGHPFAVLLLDIDGLKRINDAFGHPVGDRALVSVAEALRGTIRSIDTPVRLGGDEFCVLAPHQTAPRVRALGERIAEAVERLDAPEGAPLSVSVGAVSCPEHAVEASRLLELADEAMYRAKASGGRVAIAAALTDAAGRENGLAP